MSNKLEIERKWKCDFDDFAILMATSDDFVVKSKTAIYQKYLLISEEVEARLRSRTNGEYSLTIKKGTGMTRSEIVINLNREEFMRLTGDKNANSLVKTRFEVDFKGISYEIDSYSFKDFVIIEKEFTSQVDAESFVCNLDLNLKEVTNDEAYYNKNLIDSVNELELL